MPRKLTAVFHTRDVSKYDGTTTRAELKELLDEHGNKLAETDPELDDEICGEYDPGELFLHTDNPEVYGDSESQFEVFGHVLSRADFETGEPLRHDDGTSDDEVQVFRLQFEVDDEGRPIPVSELILLKTEDNPESEDAAALFAYFLGTPTPDALLLAFHQRYPTTAPEEAGYEPEQLQDAVADRAGLQRWFLCQRV